MKPLMYSTIDAKNSSIGWRRCGENISYFKNEDVSVTHDDDDEYDGFYTLTFNIEFPHDNDTVYFAHSYPYTYSDLQVGEDYFKSEINKTFMGNFNQSFLSVAGKIYSRIEIRNMK